MKAVKVKMATVLTIIKSNNFIDEVITLDEDSAKVTFTNAAAAQDAVVQIASIKNVYLRQFKRWLEEDGHVDSFIEFSVH